MNDFPSQFFGCYRLKPGDETYTSVSCALKVGYRAIDTASLYKNEEDVGRAVRDFAIERDSIFIQTKIWDADQGYHSTITALRSSLKRLGFHYVDSLLIHSPRKGRASRQETWKAMSYLRDIGLVRHIGVSNFGKEHIEEILPYGLPFVNQIDCSPFNQRLDLIQYCKDRGILIQAYSPLTRGMRLQHPVLLDIAKKYGSSPAKILLAFSNQICHSFAVKSCNAEHIKENYGGRPLLSEADMNALRQLEENLLVMGRDITGCGLA